MRGAEGQAGPVRNLGQGQARTAPLERLEYGQRLAHGRDALLLTHRYHPIYNQPAPRVRLLAEFS